MTEMERRKIRFIKTFSALAILSILLMYGCGGESGIPDEMVGKWISKAEKYEGTFFELTKNEIIFGTKEGKVSVYTITKIKIKKAPDGAGILYDITYEDISGLEFKFPLLYNPTYRVIRFKNQSKIIWKKDKD